ncbi:hypothetical protein [Frigoriflavimonas asaccharolytica]|uniref:MoxR-vWA-beta-propeller ternary system domain-containing protein n=1 Tax=Frigoriflavimonas asaccharolytica TaxID=2735899 RepID=A0A8J8G9K7_9FLAO|nr:hypothetical protein [Frigoriflavimonas asaccharolytica]NRS93653.1 hypothetical protein [Frigoriflavimonas asaccharolytica]
MELKIKPFPYNLHAKRAVFIKGNTAEYWISELQKMNIHLNASKCFEIFDKENALQGCLVVLTDIIKFETFQHSIFQLAGNAVFIPEFSAIFPEIAESEWTDIFNYKKFFLHPEIGFQELSHEIIWTEFLKFNKEETKNIVKPLKSARIPKEMKSLLLDLDEEDVLKDLEKNEKPDPNEKSPFDMEKLLKGNKRELEKYLRFLDKNPEKALQYAIPLDILNSSREKSGGIFKFSGTNDYSTSKNLIFRVSIMVIGIIFIRFLFATFSNEDSKQPVYSEIQTNSTYNREAAFISKPTKISLLKDSLLADYHQKLNKIKHSHTEISTLLHEKEISLNDSLQIYFEKKYALEAKQIFEKNKGKYLSKINISENLKPNDLAELNEIITINKTKSIKDSLKKKIGFEDLLTTKPILQEIPFKEDSIISVYEKQISALNLSRELYTNKILDRKKSVQDSLRNVYGKKIIIESQIIYGERKKNIGDENSLKKTIRDSLEYEYGYARSVTNSEAPKNLEDQNAEDKLQLSWWDSALRALAFIILAMFVMYLFGKRKYGQTFWEDISISEDRQNYLAKFFAIIIIIASISYVLKPLIEDSGYGLFFWIVTIIIFILLLKLLNKNKTILKSDDDEDTQ